MKNYYWIMMAVGLKIYESCLKISKCEISSTTPNLQFLNLNSPARLSIYYNLQFLKIQHSWSCNTLMMDVGLKICKRCLKVSNVKLVLEQKNLKFLNLNFQPGYQGVITYAFLKFNTFDPVMHLREIPYFLGVILSGCEKRVSSYIRRLRQGNLLGTRLNLGKVGYREPRELGVWVEMFNVVNVKWIHVFMLSVFR